MNESPDAHIRAAARLLSQGCDWSLFLAGLSSTARLQLLAALSADAKAPEVHAFVGNLDARRLEVARRCAQEARVPRRFRSRSRRRRNPESRKESLYDTEPLPAAAVAPDFVRRMISQVAPAAALLGASALLRRFGGGLVTRTREDYERGMECVGGCGKTIRLGDVTIKSMTCMTCGGEACEGCQPAHERMHSGDADS